MTVPSFILLSVIGIILFEAHGGGCQFVPVRCMCLKSNKFVRKPISDFSITEKTSYCKNVEIILTLQEDNMKVCLSPDGDQGKRLVSCWNRINKDDSKKEKCLRRNKPKTQRTQEKPTEIPVEETS